MIKKIKDLTKDEVNLIKKEIEKLLDEEYLTVKEIAIKLEISEDVVYRHRKFLQKKTRDFILSIRQDELDNLEEKFIVIDDDKQSKSLNMPVIKDTLLNYGSRLQEARDEGYTNSLDEVKDLSALAVQTLKEMLDEQKKDTMLDKIKRFFNT